jgi:hypothetical protein
MFITQPCPAYLRKKPRDCLLFARCASDDDNDAGWGWGDVLGTVVDFTPIIGDLKGIYEAVGDPNQII